MNLRSRPFVPSYPLPPLRASSQVRPTAISRLLEMSHQLGLRDEVAHDAVLLTDRTASQGKQVRSACVCQSIST